LAEFHVPVMAERVCEALAVKGGGVYVDATAGGGGHLAAIARMLDEKGMMVAIDKDPEAVRHLHSINLSTRGTIILAQSDFSMLDRVLQSHSLRAVDGVLLDLGVSSHQIDTPRRGFSYMTDAPLDMRMDPAAPRSAHDILRESSSKELAGILARYGEVRNPLRMARTLRECADTKSLESSAGLRACLEREYGPNLSVKVLSKVFQALRIAVNDELERLKTALEKSCSLLRSGGRLAVISYHSLEDRIVKDFFRGKEGACSCPPGMPVCRCNRVFVLKRITKKPIVPDPQEIARNRRSRSARLRVAEKV
jgi:16S rRNA (cytosine1402-N4)-methyltransferase